MFASYKLGLWCTHTPPLAGTDFNLKATSRLSSGLILTGCDIWTQQGAAGRSCPRASIHPPAARTRPALSGGPSRRPGAARRHFERLERVMLPDPTWCVWFLWS